MNEIFLTTRFSNDIYQLIIKSCLFDIEKTNKKKVKPKVINLKKGLDFFFYPTV